MTLKTKRSLKEKIAIGFWILGGTCAIASLYTMPKAASKKEYETGKKESILIGELYNLDYEKLLTTNNAILQEYSVFREDYKKDLESELQELQSSSQYITEKQKWEKSDYWLLTFASLLLSSLVSMIISAKYIDEERWKRYNSETRPV